MSFEEIISQLEAAIAADGHSEECISIAGSLCSSLRAHSADIHQKLSGKEKMHPPSKYLNLMDRYFFRLAKVLGKDGIANSSRISILRCLVALGSATEGMTRRYIPCKEVVELLADSDFYVRLLAVEAMGSAAAAVAFTTRDLEALLAVIGALVPSTKSNLTWMIRRKAILALSMMDQHEILEDELYTRRGDGGNDIPPEIPKGSAWSTFCNSALQHVILPCLEDSHAAVREAAILCFQRWTYAATSKHNLVLLEARFEHANPIVRKAALDAYSQIVGIRSSRDDNSGTSNGGSDELIGVGVTPRLFEILQSDTNSACRAACLQVLAKLCRRLNDTLQNDKWLSVSRRSSWSSISKSSLDILLTRLTDEDAWVRGAAVEAVGSIGMHVSQVPAEIAKRLKDTDWLVRAVAATRINEATHLAPIPHMQNVEADAAGSVNGEISEFSIEAVVDSLEAMLKPKSTDAKEKNVQGKELRPNSNASLLLDAQLRDTSWWLQHLSEERNLIQNTTSEVAKRIFETEYNHRNDSSFNNPKDQRDDTGEDNWPDSLGRIRSRSGSSSMDELMLERLTLATTASRQPQSPECNTPRGERQQISPPVFQSWRLPLAVGTRCESFYQEAGSSRPAAVWNVAKAGPRTGGWV